MHIIPSHITFAIYEENIHHTLILEEIICAFVLLLSYEIILDVLIFLEILTSMIL
jgi:hypothetical protein